LIVSFDIDGVIAATTDADFNPKRTAIDYFSKPIHPSLDVGTLNRLISQYQVYFITARSFENALSTTRRWLFNIGVDVEECMGVLCAQGAKEEDASPRKVEVVKWLGSALHVDDHSKIIPPLGKTGVLFYNPTYEENTKLYEVGGDFYTVKDWTAIESICRETFVKRGFC
jgi:hypothetical protein